MFGLFSDIIQYALGGAVVSLLLTLALVALLLFLLKGLRDSYDLTPLSLISAAVLTVGTLSQTVPMGGAIALKWKCADMIEWIDSTITPAADSLAGTLSSQEAGEIFDAIAADYPVVSAIADPSVLNGQTVTTVSNTLKTAVDSFLDPIIWDGVLWGTILLIATGIAVAFTMKRRRRPSSDDFASFADIPAGGGSYDDYTNIMY